MHINSFTEWDSLRTMMVADINGEHPDIKYDVNFKLEGKHLYQLVKRTKTMLDEVCEQLDKLNVKVIRPDPTKFKGDHRFPMLNIRDRLGVVGNKLIRYSLHEAYHGYDSCIDMKYDFTFDETFDKDVWPDKENSDEIINKIPYLEGANLLRCGSIIFSSVKNTGNEKGISLLQEVLGNEYKVVPVTTVLNHLDAHMNFVNNKLMLYDARMDISEIKPYIPNVKTVPIIYEKISKQPELVWPDIQDDDIENTNLLMSNTITIDPETVLCLNAKYGDIEFFHNNNIQCISINWPEQWLVNAGLHCFTVDLERDGTFGNPFDKT